MKYIKKYEIIQTNRDDKFWKVQTIMPNFEISLDKIGVSEKDKMSFVSKKYYNNISDYKYIYIQIDYAKWLPQGMWSWSSEEPKLSQNMGEIEVTREDIDDWNLNNDQNKYNL